MSLLTRFAGPSNSAGGLNPASIAGCQLWLDANDATKVFTESGGTYTTLATADNDAAGGWQDKSGNARHFFAAADNNRPFLDTNHASANSKRVISFRGPGDADLTTDTLSNAVQMSSYRAVNAHTWFVVFLSSSATAATAVIRSTASATNNINLQVTTGVITHLLADAGGNTSDSVTPAASFNVVNLVCCRHVSTDAATGDLWISNFGGTEETASGIGDLVNGTNTLNLGHPTLAAALTGWIGEVILYNVTVPVADRNRIGRYLSAKWGVAWTDHS